MSFRDTAMPVEEWRRQQAAPPQQQRRSAAPTEREVMAQIDQAAQKIRSYRPGLTREQATAEALESDPALYAAYRQAHRARVARVTLGLEDPSSAG